MLGATWAIKKCHKFLAGLPHFEIATNHNPLLAILNNKRLDEIENPRLQRMKAKLMAYNFTARWQRGTLHHAGDALSRNPVSDPDQSDEMAETSLQSLYKLAALSQRVDLNVKLKEVQEAALDDQVYQQLKSLILSGFPHSKAKLPDVLKPFWQVRHDLAVDDDLIVYGCRLYIPKAIRPRILANLHDSHQGINRTRERARLAVYWPRIDSDIKIVVASCKKCQADLPSLTKEPMLTRPQATRPFQELAIDLAHVNAHNYLIMVDCFTDWPSIHLLGKNTTSSVIINALRNYFSRTAVPDIVYSDGGPQFTSHVFTAFLLDWGVAHVISSPHYPQSNGNAAAAVKSMKKLIRGSWNNRTIDEDKLARAQLQYRNTPTKKDGASPAQKLFGHPVQDTIPVHKRAFSPE